MLLNYYTLALSQLNSGKMTIFSTNKYISASSFLTCPTKSVDVDVTFEFCYLIWEKQNNCEFNINRGQKQKQSLLLKENSYKIDTFKPVAVSHMMTRPSHPDDTRWIPSSLNKIAFITISCPPFWEKRNKIRIQSSICYQTDFYIIGSQSKRFK